MATGTGILNDIATAGALLRISDEKKDAQGKRVSFDETLKNHKEKIAAFAAEYGIKLQWFEEVMSGGSALDERKELVDLLNQIEKFNAIIVMELPRLARQGTISQLIKEKVIQYRKLIITLNPFQIYDMANNPMDAMFYDFGSAMAEYERRLTGARIKENKLIMSRSGLNASGKVPMGYRRNPNTKLLEIYEDEAKVVRMLFQMITEGKGLTKITEEMNQMGYKSRDGNYFCRNTLKGMLKRETYKGTMVYNDFIRNGKKKEIKDTIRIENAHPAIIEPELFDAVQNIRMNRSERFGQVNREREGGSRSIVKDLLFCATCGKKLRIAYEAKRGKPHIRKCSDWKSDGSKCNMSGMPADDLGKIVLQHVFIRKEELDQKIKELKSDDFSNYKEELEKQIAELETLKKKLQMEFRTIMNSEKKYEMQKEETGYEDDFEEEMIAEDKQKNKTARAKVQQKLQDLNDKLQNIGTPANEVKKFQQTVNIIQQLTKNPSEEKMNILLKRIIHKIYYSRELPEELAQLGAKNPLRLAFPATIQIEYIQ
jgi:site-specific DNA recombinase